MFTLTSREQEKKIAIYGIIDRLSAHQPLSPVAGTVRIFLSNLPFYQSISKQRMKLSLFELHWTLLENKAQWLC